MLFAVKYKLIINNLMMATAHIREGRSLKSSRLLTFCGMGEMKDIVTFAESQMNFYYIVNPN